MESEVAGLCAWQAALEQFLQFGDNFNEHCGELQGMLQSGVMKPTDDSSAITAEQRA